MKLGKIFKNVWALGGFLLVLFLLVFLKPWQWLGNRYGDATKIRTSVFGLYDAMKWSGVSDGAECLRICGNLSGSDLEKVYEEFGLRYYNSLFGVESQKLFGTPLDLFGWFKHELEEDEKDQMRLIWSNTSLNVGF